MYVIGAYGVATHKGQLEQACGADVVFVRLFKRGLGFQEFGLKRKTVVHVIQGWNRTCPRHKVKPPRGISPSWGLCSATPDNQTRVTDIERLITSPIDGHVVCKFSGRGATGPFCIWRRQRQAEAPLGAAMGARRLYPPRGQ